MKTQNATPSSDQSDVRAPYSCTEREREQTFSLSCWSSVLIGYQVKLILVKDGSGLGAGFAAVAALKQNAAELHCSWTAWVGLQQSVLLSLTGYSRGMRYLEMLFAVEYVDWCILTKLQSKLLCMVVLICVTTDWTFAGDNWSSDDYERSSPARLNSRPLLSMALQLPRKLGTL